LVNDFGFDYAFNYKTVVNQRAKLQEFCPSGIDVYFDNVGGETLDIVLTLMNVHGRITCCGMISQYNATTPYKLKNLINVVGKQLKLQGFIVGVQFADPAYMKKFGNDMATWMKGGRLKYSENAVEGLENAPKAFIGMLNGQNTGKAIVKLA
jgi:NADPH-dependent curcumin reductase CurA